VTWYISGNVNFGKKIEPLWLTFIRESSLVFIRETIFLEERQDNIDEEDVMWLKHAESASITSSNC
jgi:hypothetical protein